VSRSPDPKDRGCGLREKKSAKSQFPELPFVAAGDFFHGFGGFVFDLEADKVEARLDAVFAGQGAEGAL